MKLKKTLCVVLAAIMMSTLVFPVGAEPSATQGGIPEGYTPIYNANDLNNARNGLTGNYILMTDIIFDDADFEVDGDFYNSGAGWLPIGSVSAAFNGTFDGNGKRIYNMLCNNNANTHVGLFGNVGATGVIKNLGIIDSSFNNNNSSYCSGAICGFLEGTVENCYNYNSSIYSKFDSGGIVGASARYSNVRNCFNSGSVYSPQCSGGIVGGNNSTISYSYNVGSLQYSTWHANGIIGYVNSYSSINSCYYLADGQRSGGLTDSAMQMQSTYTGFDFENIWIMSNFPQYPYPMMKNNYSGEHINAEPSTPTNGNVTISIYYPSEAVKKEYKIGAGEWVEYGDSFIITENNSIYARYSNSAGSYSEIFSLDVNNIDRVAPEAPSLDANPKTPTNGNVALTITYPTDAAIKEYKIGTGSWSAYATNVSVAVNGTVYARCFDAAGNISNTNSITISNIDKTPPVVPAIAASPTTPASETVTVTITYPSEAAKKEYKLSGGEWINYKQPVLLTANTTVFARCADAVGNYSGSALIVVSNIRGDSPVHYTPIYNIEELYLVRNNLAGNYILMNDIDMSVDTAPGGDWDDGRGWSPIGPEFSGVFDGNEYSIIGMQINVPSLPLGSPSDYYSGLFAMNSGIVRNLYMNGGSVSITTTNQSTYFGAIVAYNTGLIYNCISNSAIYINNTINTENATNTCYVSGIVGYNEGEINKVSNNGNLLFYSFATNANSKSYTYLGGVAAYNVGKIINSNNLGALYQVSQSTYAGERQDSWGRYYGVVSYANTYNGGISGYNIGIISRSYNSGEVGSKLFSSGYYYRFVNGNPSYSITGHSNCSSINGGIVGFTSSGSDISDVYNCGVIFNLRDTDDGNKGSAFAFNGGIIGRNESSITVINGSYNIGQVPSISDCNEGYIGGIVGYSDMNPESFNYCYYKNDCSIGVGHGNDPCLSKSDTMLKVQGVYQGFDFDNIWFINPNLSYPYPQLIENNEYGPAPATPSFESLPIELTNISTTVTITYPDTAAVKEYRIGTGNWTTYTEPLILSSNNIVYARCIAAEGNFSRTGSVTVSNIIQNGDVNYDGNISGLDALMALQAASKLLVLNDLQISLADVNYDGKITPIDALKILQYASGLITSF